MELKIGDKVKVKSTLVSGKEYGPSECKTLFTGGMVKYKGQLVTINEVVTKNEYKIEEDDGEWFWNINMFQPVVYLENETGTSNEAIAEVLKEISDNLNKRTMYDDAMQQVVLDKVKEVSTQEIVDSINEQVKEFIKKNYGVLPKKIVVEDKGERKEVEGIFHNKFEEILVTVKANVPVMLHGPAGAGKNHTLEQVAKALGLDFYFTNAVTNEFKLLGFTDAKGNYQKTQLYEAATNPNGALFFFDEVDASDAQAMIVMNSAIANRYIDFPAPIGRVDLNDNFRFVFAGNTYGTGADMIYVGRNQLDAATLDRFAQIDFDYDPQVESQLAYDNDLYQFIVALRNEVAKNSIRQVVSMRATINATKLMNVGLDKKKILQSVILKNMQADDLNVIVEGIKGQGEWFNLLREVANERNQG